MMKPLKLIFNLCICSVILCGFAFSNKYPFVYSDTTTYIRSGFEGYFPPDRPIFYGLFLRHVSFKASLFLVIFAQGLLTASMIFLFFKKITATGKPMMATFISCVILSCTTGISVNVGWLIPDIFTPVCCLSLILLLFAKKLNIGELIYLSLIFVAGSMMHLSHLLICFLFSLLIMILYFIKKTKFHLFIQRLILPVALTCSSLILFPSIHYYYDGKFVYSEMTHIFRISKLIDIGVMEDFLQTHCNDNNYSLCQYKDSDILYRGFMWDPRSPANLDGGWGAHKEEYNKIADEILSERKYQLVFIRKTIENTFVQLFNYNVGAFGQRDAVLVQDIIKTNFKGDLHDYLITKQATDSLNFDMINLMQNILLCFSFIVIIISLGSDIFLTEQKIFWRILFSSFMIFIFINSFVCSYYSNVDYRYLSRIIWVIPLFMFAVVIEALPLIKARIGECIKN